MGKRVEHFSFFNGILNERQKRKSNHQMTEREKLVAKLQKGTFTREDLEKLMKLILEDPSTGEEDILKQLWQQLDHYDEGLKNIPSEAILKRTRSQIEQGNIGQPLQAKTPRSKTNPLKRGRRRFLQSAAAAVLLLILGTITWIIIDQQQLTHISTDYGEQIEFTLPDQSIVQLNSNSSISFRQNWEKNKNRQVRLKGEAYFQVQKKPQTNQKFQVLTKDLKVEVLGTTFNVNVRNDKTTVFLEEGKINLILENREEDLGMTPGEIVAYSRQTRLPEKKLIVEEVPASWRNGTVEFRDSPLKDILGRLSEIYGLEVVYENRTHLDRRFQVSIPIEKLDVAFEVLKEVTQLDLAVQGKQIIVK